MAKKPLPQRKSPRLQGYDYASDGAYFVTICTYERYMHFGLVNDGVMQLDDMGQIAERCWREIPAHYPTVELDYFVVMPNHMHGIIILDNQGAEYQPKINNHPNADRACPVPTDNGEVGTWHAASTNDKGTPVKPHTLGQIIGSYKSAVTRAVRQIDPHIRLWQGRYHDKIIRTDEALNYLRQYVLSNPAKWSEDEFYRETYL